MAHVIADRVADTSTTTGTSDFTVANSPPTGFETLNTVLATSDTFDYLIQHQSANEWEVGVGTYSGSHVFVRTTVQQSSNSDNVVNFSAGTKDVLIVHSAFRVKNPTLIGGISFVSGAALNWNGGDVTITHSSNALAIAGADSGVSVSHLGAANNPAISGSHAGSAIKWANSNPDYFGSMGTISGGGTPFWALHAEHSATANTLKNSGAGVKGMYAAYDGTTLSFIFNGVATASADFSSTVTGFAMTNAGALTLLAALSVPTIELGGTDTTLSRSAAGELAVEGTVVKKVGKETIFIPAGAMIARTTNGAASGTTELATNDVMLRTFDFDTTTEEGVGFWVAMPKSWNESTVTFKAFWTAASGSGGVALGLAAYSFSNDDAMDTAVSGQQVVTDTLITANDMHVTDESSAITIGGTPAEGDVVYFEIERVVGNGSDTLGVDAKLIGIHLYITSNASTDA